MGKLIFRYTDSDYLDVNREASEVSLTVPDDMTVNEYKLEILNQIYWVYRKNNR